MSTIKKQFFANHTKSSAALISLGIHAVLIVVALSYVAVTVIKKEEPDFEAKPVNRPKMQLKKLQVPVNIKKKKTQKPKLRKRIVVKPKLNQNVPDIKMPEITGVKGGMGSAGAGLGGGGGLGFAMPEMELFGIKGRGEKVFIVLDASAFMMVDEMGGIPAYTIIKSELVRILEGLNSTVLFNIAVYGGGEFTLFPEMVSASGANVAKVEAWLKPLNAVSKGMASDAYGPKTRGSEGVKIPTDFEIEPLKNSPGGWVRPTLLAMKQQADVVFVLTCHWGWLHYETEEESKPPKWSESDKNKFEKALVKARKMFEEENERRSKKGQPPRVIPYGGIGLVRAYVPGTREPPDMRKYVLANYTPDQLAEAFANTRKKWNTQKLTRSGLGKKKKEIFSINVIHFVKTGSGSTKDPRFSRMASESRGEYRKIEGMDAIQSYQADNSED